MSVPLQRAWATNLATLGLLLLHPPPASARPGTHAVTAGQTLWSIAYTHGVKVDELMQANGLDDPSKLAVGFVLVIPEPAPGQYRAAPRLAAEAEAFRWPLRGRLTSRYGRRGRREHTGLDIAAPRGSIVVAAAGGTVVRGGTRWGRYGNVVLIEHGGNRTTLYAHLNRSFVREGEAVQAGQAIGAVGSSGNATGPHLHFELWASDQTVDPLPHLPSQVERISSLR